MTGRRRMQALRVGGPKVRKYFEDAEPVDALAMPEDSMLVGIVGAAAHSGWLVHHCEAAPTQSGGWATPIGDSSPGFPDLVLTHLARGKILVLELKSDTGRYEPGQREWLAAFRAAGVDARTVTPPEYDALIRELAGDQLLKMSGGRKP